LKPLARRPNSCSPSGAANRSRFKTVFAAGSGQWLAEQNKIKLNRGGSRAKSKCGSRVCRPDAAFSQSADGSSSSDCGAGLLKFRRIDDDLA
jgi:hypothetical protein